MSCDCYVLDNKSFHVLKLWHYGCIQICILLLLFIIIIIIIIIIIMNV